MISIYSNSDFLRSDRQIHWERNILEFNAKALGFEFFYCVVVYVILKHYLFWTFLDRTK